MDANRRTTTCEMTQCQYAKSFGLCPGVQEVLAVDMRSTCGRTTIAFEPKDVSRQPRLPCGLEGQVLGVCEDVLLQHLLYVASCLAVRGREGGREGGR